ncbi:DUF6734 family protein [Maribacter flavus]|uniref:DUF6734 domain-containing protein n=1 Tax=Maribacter flavus TaxID=1658664 RepID=A0A5B2TVI4_9FLAO|nr:DUF6734 family protein [Maribacter flavus]KAA2218526.1 hypothetical protein F0361_02575 [Maribacter flavus]
MKILHSFWSKPALNKYINLDKFDGGWRHPKYHLMSWALSCLSFKKHYGKIELVTDIEGKSILIEKLKLPYSNVRVELDSLNHYPPQLWAIGKLYSYGIQEEPFIHVDGDAFIWGKIGANVENSELIAHHADDAEYHYFNAMEHIKERNFRLPQFLMDDFKRYKKFNTSSAGIIGGNNFKFFKEYSKKAFDFIDANLHLINGDLNGTWFALIYEQYFFSVMAREKHLKINHVFTTDEITKLNFVSFLNKYGPIKYVHLLAHMKSSIEYCRRMELQLILEYPEYHKRIIELV